MQWHAYKCNGDMWDHCLVLHSFFAYCCIFQFAYVGILEFMHVQAYNLYISTECISTEWIFIHVLETHRCAYSVLHICAHCLHIYAYHDVFFCIHVHTKYFLFAYFGIFGLI